MIELDERSPARVHGSRRRIVLTTFGSLGDLHPYIAIALGLQERGHEAILATSGMYREKIEALGLGFRPVRPDIPEDPRAILRFFDLRRGPERLIREFFMPVLRESYEDTLAAARGADVLLGHPLTFTTRLVAEKQNIPWASAVLAPMNFLSAYDPPVMPPAPILSKLHFLGPAFHRVLFRLVRSQLRTWTEPWHRLRAELGLPPVTDDALFIESSSPTLVLALFSEVLGTCQPDWPQHTVITGFPFYDRDGEEGLPPALAQFLDDGPPPIVFTLGSSAIFDPGEFYEHSARAANNLNRRAVLLVGRDLDNAPKSLPPGVVAFDYAPFSEIFPKAAASVHQGGIGTTAQALRAGRPMLVVPFAFDQPDNADRVRRMGVACTIPRSRYCAELATRELWRILDDPAYAEKASTVSHFVQQEDGVGRACDALETMLHKIGAR